MPLKWDTERYSIFREFCPPISDPVPSLLLLDIQRHLFLAIN